MIFEVTVNHGFYMRNRFKVVREHRQSRGGCIVWAVTSQASKIHYKKQLLHFFK
jgi:hypothetical protein